MTAAATQPSIVHVDFGVNSLSLCERPIPSCCHVRWFHILFWENGNESWEHRISSSGYIWLPQSSPFPSHLHSLLIFVRESSRRTACRASIPQSVADQPNPSRDACR